MRVIYEDLHSYNLSNRFKRFVAEDRHLGPVYRNRIRLIKILSRIDGYAVEQDGVVEVGPRAAA